MAKHNKGRKGRSMTKYLKGAIDQVLTFTGLAAGDVVGGNFDETVPDSTLCSSIVAAYTFGSILNDADGPYVFGVAHSDYTDAEILEYLVNDGSWTRGNQIGQEMARRKIRRIGSWAANQAATANTGDYMWNEGRKVKTKLNWMLQEGQTLKYWVFNRGGVAVSTGNLIADGHANLWQ